jgi:hypothetical protein
MDVSPMRAAAAKLTPFAVVVHRRIDFVHAPALLAFVYASICEPRPQPPFGSMHEGLGNSADEAKPATMAVD